MRIGISGARGSFSEEAARIYVREGKIEDHELVYLTFVEQVLEALENGEIDTGIFAIENSNGGVVTEYLPAIGKHRFGIEKIFEMKVDHMLLAKKDAKREDVKKIVSQNQALRQCRAYLRRVWPTAEVIEYIDTATAAKDLHEGKLGNDAAVIASRATAELYDLQIMEEGVQDMKFNFTTFIVGKKLPD